MSEILNDMPNRPIEGCGTIMNAGCAESPGDPIGVRGEARCYSEAPSQYMEQSAEEKIATFRARPVADQVRLNRRCLREFPVTFSFNDKGCTISIGCKIISFSTTEEAMQEFQNYIMTPVERRAYWEDIIGS